MTPVLASVAGGLDKHDALAYGGVAAALAIVSAVACILPAWRAMRVDPPPFFATSKDPARSFLLCGSQCCWFCLGVVPAVAGKGSIDAKGYPGWTGFVDESSQDHLLLAGSLRYYLTTSAPDAWSRT